jgi:hypothetical protein
MIVVLHERHPLRCRLSKIMKNRTKNLKRKGILSALKIKEEPMRTKHCKSLQFTDLYITCCKLLGYVSVASAREYWNRGIEKSTACPLMFPCVTSGRNYSVLGQAVTDRRGSPLIKSWLQRGAVSLVVTTDCTKQIRAMPAMFTLGCALRRESSHD